MAVNIGHARGDERGGITGGAAGDQTGQEVCTRSWYCPSGGWVVLLRPKSSDVAERMAAACEAGCNNPRIGYDQYQRNTLRTQARRVGFDLARITTACECDCSSFVAVCAEAAGVDMDGTYTSGNAPTTSTMRAKFVGTGAFTALTDAKYLTGSAYLRRGDVLVLPGKHTVMVLSDGASATTTNTNNKEEIDVTTKDIPTLKRGSKGETVKALQRLLKSMGYYSMDIDGSAGEGTVRAIRAYQSAKGLGVDGSCGPKTWAKLLGV